MKGRDKLVLYLDFDGVLHHHNCVWHPNIGPYLAAPDEYKIFQHVELLQKLLEPYPQVGIILSTAWVRRYGCAKSAKNLGHTLRHRVLGATFHSRMNEEEFGEKLRGQQVWEDVLRRRPRDWIAVDDVGDGWPAESAGKFIQTDEKLGISKPTVLAELEAALMRLCAH